MPSQSPTDTAVNVKPSRHLPSLACLQRELPSSLEGAEREGEKFPVPAVLGAALEQEHDEAGDADADAGAGESGVHNGEGGRVPAPGRVQGGGCRPPHRSDGPGVADDVPSHRPVRLLPARRVPCDPPQPRPRHRPRRLPLGRRHLPRRCLLHFPADSTNDSSRGMAFGWLQLTGNIGSIIGSLCSVLIASTSFLGIPGWRIAFHLVAIISVVVGILVRLFANDPRNSDDKNLAKDRNSLTSFWSELKDLVKEAKLVMRIPSFQIIVAQGVSGSFPWSALSFTAMWLELIGFTHKTTAFLVTIFIIAGSLGGLFGGYMGDILAKRLPNSGRIILSQISSGSAIPLAAVLLLALPDDPSTAFMHGLVLFIMGLIISWNAPATNNPIFAEIVPEKSRTSIYALDRSFESVIASFATPLVGIMARHVYGYKQLPKGSSGSVEIETDRENAASLAKALYTAIGIPMTICCFIYSFLYCTYPRDRDRARMTVLIESEMQQMEVNSPHSEENLDNLDMAKSNSGYEKDRSVIDIDDGMEESIDLDDNDEKSLLSRQLTFADVEE
ncbi:uncharacterized protein LOC115661906 isoform X3 [Syzygium oleosum]|uniref:uncharacterized protein LOC115661906 isoform X3 n=1 Tax=Syzygium oleosum TaxID=219896 RepID=UPI0024BA7691|nr:uncharacterized protein LOC115661906 isoform X3 [Syzygium oleosum]